MTPREFVALYIMREHSIINPDRSNTIDWFISRFHMNCQALECMDVDCTEVHNAIKDVQNAVERLQRVSIQKQLAFFTQDNATNDSLKHYISGLRLFLDKSPNESMDDFEERFKNAFITSDLQLPNEEEEQEVAVVQVNVATGVLP